MTTMVRLRNMLSAEEIGRNPASASERFLKRIKRTLGRHVYNSFCQALKEFGQTRDVASLGRRATQLLAPCPDYIRQLDLFIPPGFRINEPVIDKACCFLNRVSETIQPRHPEIYKKFLDVLNSQDQDQLETYQKASMLLKDFPELLFGFDTFFEADFIDKAKKLKDSSGTAADQVENDTIIN